MCEPWRCHQFLSYVGQINVKRVQHGPNLDKTSVSAILTRDDYNINLIPSSLLLHVIGCRCWGDSVPANTMSSKLSWALGLSYQIGCLTVVFFDVRYWKFNQYWIVPSIPNPNTCLHRSRHDRRWSCGVCCIRSTCFCPGSCGGRGIRMESCGHR